MPIRPLFADVEIPPLDLWSMYLDQKRDYPDHHGLLIDGDTGRTYNYTQIRDLSVAFGRGLIRSCGWSRGDVLAFYTPNSIDTPVLNLGLHWAAGTASPANPTYTTEELARQLGDCGARLIATQAAYLDAVLAAARQVGLTEKDVILLGDERRAGFRHWRDIAREGEGEMGIAKPAIDSKKDVAYLVYSSGTTGLPKGVTLTHFNMVANAVQAKRFDIKGLNWDIDAQLGVLPFFHIYGLAVVLNATFITGARCVVMPRWDLEKACALIQKHRLTCAYVPPPIVLALSKDPIVSRYDLSSIRWINAAAAPVSKELVDAVWERLKIGVKQGYGLSETSPTITTQLADEWARFQGSVGRLFPNMTAKIVDPEGNEVPVGKTGELLVKGPNVFGGYWKRPDLQKDTFTEDGWFKTGDVFYVDDKGNFYITDRIKELIKYKGFQVAPAELEDKLHRHPAIADVAVVGVWNKQEYTEVPRAYVVPQSGQTADDKLAKDIADWLADKVAPPKKLRGGVRFVEAIPKSQSGKILRRILKEEAKKEDVEPKAKL